MSESLAEYPTNSTHIPSLVIVTALDIVNFPISTEVLVVLSIHVAQQQVDVKIS